MIQKKFVIVLLLLASCTLAQSGHPHLDSLSTKSFEYLKKKFEATLYDPTKSKSYALAWLKKAKSEKNNYVQLALAYRASAIFGDKSLQLRYADSMIYNAKRTSNNELIGSSYMSKGILFYNQNQHISALDYYLKADQYISQSENAFLKFQIKYGIAQIKYYLGLYDEAIALYRESITFFEEENDRAYLNAMHGLGLCYTRTGKYDLASQTNQLGIEHGRLFEDTSMELYFKHSEGINQCHRGNYLEAIKLLNTTLPNIVVLKDHANTAVAYFYIGKSYWSLKKTKEAIAYFKKVDEIFQKENYMLPDLRKGYEYLIDYYKQKGDTKSQLFYIDQLLQVDRLLAKDYKYLLKKIVKEYDTKELLKEKNTIENKIVATRIAASAIVLLMSVAIIYLIQRNRRNVKLFEEIMKRDTSKSVLPFTVTSEEQAAQSPETMQTNNNGKPITPDISKDIEDAIVKKLEKFESTKKYLEKDMNLSKMATILHTNSKYVTKVIAKHRKKGTIEYITELKLDYIIEMLKTDSKFRNYTHKALGEEAGFRTTQNFTRAFKSYAGISPTYFINKLKKSMTDEDSQ
jgi:tetratricopeptide (TPR) repeat protein